TFEVDTGPEIRFYTYGGANPPQPAPLVNDILFRDGEFFTLNGTNYEFDSGPVYLVQGAGSNFQDGQVFTVTDTNNISKTFEYDSNNSLVNPTNVRIGFTIGDSAVQVTQSTVAAINGAGLLTQAQTPNPNSTRISLTNDKGVTTVSPATP